MPSTTMSKELPEMDTGKEVHVQDGEELVNGNSVAASVLVEDGEEHVPCNSMAAPVHVQDGEELVNGNSVAASCKNSAKVDRTKPSTTMSKELPEMDTGKEVHVQDGEEHVNGNSVAASEMNGDVGIEKQGEELEEGINPVAGASYLHPLVLDESESDAEYQAWINNSSSSPEDSWLHALYFYLVGAGFDGFEVRELFRSKGLPWSKAFKHPAAALAEPEKRFEETHLQSMGDMQMPYNSRAGNQGDDSNGEQLQQQMPKNRTVRNMINSRLHPRSKAFKRPAAALAEPKKEVEEMHQQSMDDVQIPSRVENQGDGSNREQLQQQMPEITVPKRCHKKTAANADPSQTQGLNCRRTTRPLPAHIAARKKNPVKKNKWYLKNRLQ